VGSLTITGELEPRGPAAAFILTDDQVQTVGEGAKRFPVLAAINGQTLRLTVARMRGEYLLGLSKANREAAGVQAGDTVTFDLALDAAPREVTTPAALAQALAADPGAQDAFDRLAFTHRKEFARWIEEAKRDETRERRVATTIEMLHAGQTRS
jgi:Bacteriocin-protection, YdeI or OmpD-Associated/Domain of unknown function (DUF1905)